MTEQRLTAVIGADVSEFQRAMRELQSSLNDTAREVNNAMGNVEENVSDGAGGVKGALKGIALAVAGAFAVDKIVEFGKTMLNTTADIQALDSQYTQVMGGMKKDTDKYLDKMSAKWNKHPNELKSAYTGYVAILKSKGLSEKEAHDTAKKYLDRTVDANAFANESMEDTTARFMGGIKGEYDSLDTAMVNLSATMMDNKAKEEYGKGFNELTMAQQELMKTQEMLRQHTSAGVFGQGALESQSYANNLAMVKNTWNELMADFGSPMLEIANSGLKTFKDILVSIKTDGFSGALTKLIPSEFKSSLDTAGRVVNNLKYALESSDWGMIGVFIGTALGETIKGIQGLGTMLGDKISSEFNSIDWEGIVTNMKEGTLAFSVSLVNMFNKDMAEQMKEGDWGTVGEMLADSIISAISSVGERVGEFSSALSGVITGTFSSIDWGQLGKDSFSFAVGFILGFVGELLNPVSWIMALANNWEVTLGLLIGIMFAPAKWLGSIGKALAKIPFVGKLLNWVLDAFAKVLQPIGNAIKGWFVTIGKNFLNGFKRAFDGNSVLGDWLAKMGAVFKGLIAKIGEKLGSINTKFQSWADSAGQKLASPFKWMSDKAGTYLGKVTDGAKKMWDSISSVASKIKTAVGGMFKGIKTPHFKVDGSMNPLKWKSEGMPKINVKWYETGGIVGGTGGGQVVGVGENHGTEAIIPLSKRSKFKPFANALGDMIDQGDSNGGTGTVIHNSFNISSMVIREEADIKKLSKALVEEQNRMSRAGGRVLYGN